MKELTTPSFFRTAAKKRGFTVGYIDPPYSSAFYISNGLKQFICGPKSSYGMYAVNRKFADYLADHKAATKRVLKKFGFRVIRGKQFYITNPSEVKILPKDKASAAYEYAQRIKYPVFVKPNSGSLGKNARIVFNKTGLQEHIKTMRADNVESFLVEKFTSRPEYRIFVVNGKAQFMYRKRRMTVTGTGSHTVHELISMGGMTIDISSLKSMLKLQGHHSNSVLPDQAEVILQETANISTGAEIVDYRDRLPKAVQDWVKELYKVTGLGVFGVDVFTKGAWDDPKNYLIIEVNSNPSLKGIYRLGHKEKVFDICNLVMDKYFGKDITAQN